METYRAFTRQSDDVYCHGKRPSALRQVLTRLVLQVLQTLMAALEKPLGLPAGIFRELHPDDKISGSETRVIRKPAEGESGYRPEGNKDNVKGASIGAHTGQQRSFTFLSRKEVLITRSVDRFRQL